MNPPAGPRATGLRHAVVGLAVAACALLALGEFTDIDLRLADAAFDRSTGDFRWRHAWFAEVLLHDWLRRLTSVVGACIVVIVTVDAVRPAPRLAAAGRLRLRAITFTALAIPLSVSLLKARSFTHCPWDVSRYGGSAAYVRLLEPATPHVAAGHCFPAGHATSALWLISLALLWLPQAPGRAALVASAAVVAGVALGALQQMRGAHFLSHTLWSAWIAVAVYTAVSVWLERRLATELRAGAP